MATEGAALSHLRDAYYILTHDLADLQLDTMKASFDKNSADPLAAAQAAPLISKLAITMMNFGTAVDSADDLVKSGQSSTKLMMAVAALLTTVGVGVGAYMLYLIVSKAVRGAGFGTGPLLSVSNFGPLGVGLSGLVSPVGGVVIGVTVFLVFMMGWFALLRDRLRQLEGPEAVLRAGFWRIRNHVCGAYAIRFSAAAQQGTLQDFKNGTGTWAVRGSDLVPAPECGGNDGEVDATAPPTCDKPLDPCGVTVPTLEAIIVASCPGATSTMLGELQNLKLSGVDAYDRMALWKTISSGIDAIRHTIAVSADANTAPTQPVTTENVQQVITMNVVPTMSLHALATAGGPNPTPDMLLQQDSLLAGITGSLITFMQSTNHAFDLSDYRTDILTHLETYYGNTYASLRAGLNTVITRVQASADARPPPANNMYVDSATMMARISDVGPSRWNDYVTETDDTRGSVRTFMANFQPVGTTSLAGDVTRSFATGLTVVGVVGLLIYTNHICMQTALGGMTKEKAVRTIVIAASLFALLVLALQGTIGRMLSRQSHNAQAIVRNGQKLVSSLETTLAECSIIANTTPAPVSAPASAPASSTPAPASALTSTTSVPTTISSADVQRYIDAAVDTVRAYDSCNSITNGARLMPFPTMDLIIYGFVVAVILSSALYGVEQLRLRDKLANIRTLTGLHDKIMDGAIPPGLLKLIECSTPDDSYRTIFVWMALLVLFAFNIYAMSNIRASQHDYDRSLELVDDCV